ASAVGKRRHAPRPCKAAILTGARGRYQERATSLHTIGAPIWDEAYGFGGILHAEASCGGLRRDPAPHVISIRAFQDARGHYRRPANELSSWVWCDECHSWHAGGSMGERVPIVYIVDDDEVTRSYYDAVLSKADVRCCRVESAWSFLEMHD